jgi:predicted dehydrogenase
VYRRKFLQTAGGVAGSSLLGSTISGKSKISPNDRISVALMGCNARGVSLARAFTSLPEVEISHICDPDSNVVDRCVKIVTQNKGRGFKLVKDIRVVLDDPAVDAVVMATPIHWHAAGTILACEAGKDVYVEKPASHNVREGQLMQQAARKNDRIVQLGTQSRSRLVTSRFVDYVRSGKIGKPLMAKVVNCQGRFPAMGIGHKPDEPVPEGVDYDIWTGPVPEMPFNRNRYHATVNWHWHYGAGDIANDGVHWLDVARWVMDVGLPLEVSGMGRKLAFNDDQQTPDTQNIEFNYDDKLITFEQRLWNPYLLEGTDNGVFVYGTEGIVQTGRWVGGRFAFRHFDKQGKLVYYEQQPGSDNATVAHAQNFLDCVRTRDLPNADIGIGHKSTLLCHLGNIVSRTGRNIRFEPDTETIVEDEEASRYFSREYRDHWSSQPLRSRS